LAQITSKNKQKATKQPFCVKFYLTMSKYSKQNLSWLKTEENQMRKFRLYRKDNTFVEIEVGGAYIFNPKIHQVYFPNIGAKIKSVYKVEVVKNAKSSKKNKEEN